MPYIKCPACCQRIDLPEVKKEPKEIDPQKMFFIFLTFIATIIIISVVINIVSELLNLYFKFKIMRLGLNLIPSAETTQDLIKIIEQATKSYIS